MTTQRPVATVASATSKTKPSSSSNTSTSAAAVASSPLLRLKTHRNLPNRIVLSLLTGRPVHISSIRASSPTTPGLAPHEVTLLRLLESVSNGTAVQISYTGTTIAVQPGLVAGAVAGQGASGPDSDVIECVLPPDCARGVTYFLFPLCALAPFAKTHVNVRFSGGVITAATAAGDVSVDSFRTGILPLFDLFGIPLPRVELKILQRACAGPSRRGGGGGVVELRFAGQVRMPKTLHLSRHPGRVKRIRGVAYCTGVSASNNRMMIDAAREVLKPLVTDIHIAAQYDQAPLVPDQTARGGPSSSSSTTITTAKKRAGIGFGLSLVAETSSKGVLYTADVPAPSEGGVPAEDVGKRCALQLLQVIEQGGCVSAAGVPMVLILMAMGSEDVGRVRLGRRVVGDAAFIQLGRDLRAFGGSTWGLRDADDDSTDVVVSVKGTGVGNVGRKIA